MHKKILLFFLIWFCNSSVGFNNLKIENAFICGRGRDVPMKIHNMTLEFTAEKGFYLDFMGDLYRDLDSDTLEAEFKFERCLSKDALDTCERLYKLRPPMLCHFLDIKETGWNEVRDAFVPPLCCPFKKGRYVGKGITLNGQLFKTFPIEGYFWRINASLFEHNEYLASLCFEATVRRSIKRLF